MSDPAPETIRPKADTWANKTNAYGAIGVTGGLFALSVIGMGVTAWKGDNQAFYTMVDRVGTMLGMAVMFWVGASRKGQEEAEAAAKSSSEKNETVAVATKALGAAVATVAAAGPVVSTQTVESPDGTKTVTTAPVVVPPLDGPKP